MPLYEFYCPRCEKLFEELLPVEHNKINCPFCEDVLDREISNSNFHLKGLGWTDDSRKQRQRWFDKIESKKD